MYTVGYAVRARLVQGARTAITQIDIIHHTTPLPIILKFKRAYASQITMRTHMYRMRTAVSQDSLPANLIYTPISYHPTIYNT
jgi:hypothetical protein